MINIGIAIVFTGVLVLVLALRGRIAAKGQFCKKCKFDLAGLDLDSIDAKCPECGNEVHQQSTRRTILRRRSRVGLTIACALMLAGIGSVGMGAAGQTRAMVAAMPDSIVLFLTDMGMDEALDELHTRTSLVPSTMSAKDWDHAIESGLAIQADNSILWDMRWGQVLFDALSNDQMSKEQVEQYFTVGLEYELLVRDRVHPGTNILPNKLRRIQTRLQPFTGGTTAYSIRNQITAVSVGETVPFFEQDLHEWKRSLRIQNDGHQSSSSAGTYGYLEFFDKSSGAQVKFVFSYTIRLDRGDELVFEKNVQEQVTVTVIDPSEPIVRVVKNDAIAQSVFDKVFMTAIKITEVFPEPPKNNRMPSPNAMAMTAEPVAKTVSFQFFMVFDDEEIKIGTMSNPTSSTNGIGAWLSVGESRKNGISNEQAREIHAKLLNKDTVTIVARTDSALMIKEPNVDEVLGMTIIFENVPIEIVKLLEMGGGVGANDTRVKPTSFESYGDTP